MDQSHGLGNWTPRNEALMNNSFPAHRACRDGDIDCLASLLSTDSVDFFEEDDFYGWTPIHWAAYYGKLPCLMKLLECGASCDAATERLNQSPAHIAAYGGQSHCLKWLLHCGATICRQLACLRRLVNSEKCGGLGCDITSSKFSQTAIHLSAYADHPQCLQWLLQSKCNVNAQDYLGETPCHKAARTGSMECISLLVSQGAKLEMRNHSGNTPAQVAASSGFLECANYLERAMQIQLQATSVYHEMRTPVTHPSTSTPTPMSNPAVSDRSSPPGVFQSPPGGNLISVNRYHSNPHFIPNGTAFGAGDACNVNGLVQNNNNQSEDCDMEMESEAPMGNGNPSCNGAMEEEHNGGIVLGSGAWRANGVQITGRKRGLDSSEEECFKRARNEELHRFPSNFHHPFSNGIHHSKDMNENHQQSDTELMNNNTPHDKNGLFSTSCNGLSRSGHDGRRDVMSVPVSSMSPSFDELPAKCVTLKSHFI